jgi:hypothetical protein
VEPEVKSQLWNKRSCHIEPRSRAGCVLFSDEECDRKFMGLE